MSEKHNEVSKKWRKNNIEKARKQAREWVARQIEEKGEAFRKTARERALKYYYNNIEKVREKDNERKRLYRLNNQQQYNLEQKEYRKNNPDKVKQYRINRKDGQKKYARKKQIEKYGITEEIYHKMFLNQEGKCAICNMPFNEKTPNIDHSHNNGKVRSLLCSSCNIILGHVEKQLQINKNILTEITKYLKTYA